MSEIQILKMLEEGTITADEAAKLLSAVEPQEAETVRETIAGALPQNMAEPLSSPTPLVSRFRHLFLSLFVISSVVIVLCGYGMVVLYRGADRRITWGFVGVLLACVLGLLFAVLMFWLWQARWLHVRIRQQDGKRLMISLPIPLMLTEWGLRIARDFVDEQTSGYLDMVSTLMYTIRHSRESTGGEPISVEVGGENEQVQVYIG
ncbi:MAG: hypothetical protein JXA89_23835 [Anaerolineae bacterium]|nr:hypothetical protein [Anaerolineae bacterium]